MFRFRNFQVYMDARIFRSKLKKLSKTKFPSGEKFILISQLWRALDSILLNIAEGSERHSDIDFSKFLNTSLTSVFEVVACLDAALDDAYISNDEHQVYLIEAEGLAKQLSAFSAKVRGKNSKT